MMRTYVFVVEGTPGPLVTAAFEEFTVTGADGGRIWLRGTLRDDAELHGVLHRLQLLGLTIVEVRRLEED
ncbi:hypothetical protein [Nocardioides insulae]|uniref:hypothetical protein n=1 Tax=Nocardioides insulae TaxID=394734 RepID=UPI0003FB05AA|nr:hypothetical protein [Nocardioides insulae]